MQVASIAQQELQNFSIAPVASIVQGCEQVILLYVGQLGLALTYLVSTLLLQLHELIQPVLTVLRETALLFVRRVVLLRVHYLLLVPSDHDLV